MGAVALLVPLAVAGCGSAAGGGAAASPGQRLEQTVQAELDGVRLELEVADDEEERAVGLMGRRSVPRGTGMLFRYDEPTTTTFWMYRVPVPLLAVFVRDGVVVGVERMAPCDVADSAQCPSYGPDAPYDTVVEVAPETLPDVAEGDRLVVR